MRLVVSLVDGKVVGVNVDVESDEILNCEQL